LFQIGFLPALFAAGGTPMKSLSFVSSILSVSVILLFAAVAVNPSSATRSHGQCTMQADGIPLPVPPPPKKFLAGPDKTETQVDTVVALEV
jgi:hypothetical protein